MHFSKVYLMLPLSRRSDLAGQYLDRDMAMRPIFRGFCINRFGVGPLHYISSRSDFGFEFADIFGIEKRLSYLVSRLLDV